MTFTLQTSLTIRGQRYTFTPARRSADKIFIDNSGGRADIYKLHCQATNTFHALKVFKPSSIDAYDDANFAFFQDLLPEMNHFAWVKQRMRLTTARDAALIQEHPSLRNAIVMPWFELRKLDELRSDIVEGTITATPAKTLHFAQLLAYALATLERKGVAHGDIAYSNILFDWDRDELYIIDIEDMYHASLTKPSIITAGGGTNGYRFDHSYTSWSASADRFAGAIMLSEILSLSNEQCNELSAEESYFTQDDIQERFNEDCDRYLALYAAINAQNPRWSQLLHQAWNETNLSKLPALAEWEHVLGQPASYDRLYQHWLVVPESTPQPSDDFGSYPEEVEISGPIIAGHMNAQNKTFRRAAFAISDSNEYAFSITSSAYYQQSVPQADTLITNALPLMQGDQAAIVAIQTCILIDLLNISVLYDKESDVRTGYKPYEAFIKMPNMKTVASVQHHLQGYGLDEGTLSSDNLQGAIEGIARLADAELEERIADITNKKFDGTLRSITATLNDAINNRVQPSQPAIDEIELQSELRQPKPVHEWYTRAADSDFPALFVFVLDLSRSMYKSELMVGSRYRYQIAEDIINNTIDALITKSLKGHSAKPRYHVAIIGYHKKHANILQSVSHTIDYAERMNNKSIKADVSAGIYPIGALEEFKLTNKVVNMAIPAGGDMDLYPEGETHMIQAFDGVYDLIKAHIDTYWDCHPPYVFHITDGANNQVGDLEAAFARITSLSTAYGNTLVSTAYIGDDLIAASQQWRGITPRTIFSNQRSKWAEMLRQISSKMPESFRIAIKKELNKDMDSDAYLFFPGTDEKMLKAAITAAVSTGSGAKQSS